MTLINRIDIALHRVGKSRSDLARALGVSAQAINNLKRRPTGELRLAHAAQAARYLGCDLYWLCTGEGEYRTDTVQSVIAAEVARIVDAMTEPERERALATIYLMSRGLRRGHPQCGDVQPGL